MNVRGTSQFSFDGSNSIFSLVYKCTKRVYQQDVPGPPGQLMFSSCLYPVISFLPIDKRQSSHGSKSFFFFCRFTDRWDFFSRNPGSSSVDIAKLKPDLCITPSCGDDEEWMKQCFVYDGPKKGTFLTKKLHLLFQ